MGLFDYPTGPAEEVPVEEVSVLEDLSEADWKKILSVVETRHFRQGEELVKMGDVDDSFYILSSGSVETLIPDGKGGWRALSVIPEGSVFGEIAFFDHGPRSASIRAVENGAAIRVTRKNFDHLAAWEPALARTLLVELGKVLSFRLRWLTTRV
ncbi:MAG TPA: cyclic nucleotide-binding domain-containing protein [Magnetospirillaceae bacterium]|jgi:CRP-like cAMP-binding protein